MLVFVPFICFILVFLSFYKGSGSHFFSRRDAFLLAALVLGFLIFISTEALSLFYLLNLSYVLGFWIFSTGISAYIFFTLPNKKKSIIHFDLLSISRLEFILIFVVVFIIILVGVVALMAPPTNWDSLVYHMSRVAHWVQNQSVSHYPTNVLIQLYINPGAEFIIAHLQILSGSDRFANLIQWFSMLGSMLGISLIAKELGAKPRYQIFTAVLAATVPMGILQGSSTQNDYVVTFWLVCFVYFIILLTRRFNRIYLMASATSLGLAILTKGTAYFYAFPFLIWFAFVLIKKLKLKSWKPILIIASIALLINTGHFTRNFGLCGHPLGKSGVINDTKTSGMSAPLLISNIVKNTGLHLGTSFKEINVLLENAIYRLHETIGVDIVDPRITLGGYSFHIPVMLHEDGAGNFCHLVLIVICAFLFIISRNKIKDRDLMRYFLSLVATFLLINLFIKWQPYSSRLHLPLFVLYSPFVAIVLSKVGGRYKFPILIAISIILISTSMPYVFRNASRRIISSKRTIFNTTREEQYFTNNRDLIKPYLDTVNYIESKKCEDIGLAFSWNYWEYPFWVLLKGNKNNEIRIEHVFVENESWRPYHLGSFNPCAVIAYGIGESKKTKIRKDLAHWEEVRFDPITVFNK